MKKPFVLTVMSTKGGVTKSTNVANIASFCADSGLKTLMIDTDVQPTLSSYFQLKRQAPCGLFEFLLHKNTDSQAVISQTIYPHLDIIQSNDPSDILTPSLRNSPDGNLRFNDLVHRFNDYDLVVVDTRGTRGITVDMSVLASDLVLSPIRPELLSAREFMRGTLGLYEQLAIFTNHGFTLPKVVAMVSCLDHTKDAKAIYESLLELFGSSDNPNISILDFTIPSRVAYREAASVGKPVHHINPIEKERIRTLCTLLLPQWKEHFNR